MKRATECDRLVKVSTESQKIGEFLDWLQNERQIVLAEYVKDSERLVPSYVSIETLLAEYFDINLDKVEQERRRILKAIRAESEERRLASYGKES